MVTMYRTLFNKSSPVELKIWYSNFLDNWSILRFCPQSRTKENSEPFHSFHTLVLLTWPGLDQRYFHIFRRCLLEGFWLNSTPLTNRVGSLTSSLNPVTWHKIIILTIFKCYWQHFLNMLLFSFPNLSLMRVDNFFIVETGSAII